MNWKAQNICCFPEKATGIIFTIVRLLLIECNQDSLNITLGLTKL